MAVRSLALLLIPGVLRPARAYDQGEDITLCWVTNATERSTVREDCDGQEMRFTSEWPERLVELTNYSFSYTFTLPRWAEPTGHRPSSSEQRYELPHANIHSCQRKVGFCTPFVEDTPGLATHTVAQRLVNVEDSGSTRMLEFTSEVILQAGQYTVIAHVYWFSPDGLRHDVARARFADFEEKPSALAIGLGVGLGVMLLLGVFSAVVVARKVHRQKKQAAAQKAAAELAAKSTEAAKLARSRLIRTVMHDLRSPLMSVDNVSRTLRAMDGQVTLASVSHLLDAIGNCSSLMEHIVRRSLARAPTRARKWKRLPLHHGPPSNPFDSHVCKPPHLATRAASPRSQLVRLPRCAPPSAVAFRSPTCAHPRPRPRQRQFQILPRPCEQAALLRPSPPPSPAA